MCVDTYRAYYTILNFAMSHCVNNPDSNYCAKSAVSARIRSSTIGCIRSASSLLEDDDSGDAGRPAVCFVFGHEIHVTAGGCWWRHATVAVMLVTTSAIGRYNALAIAPGQSS